jgi:hypothetical protein
MEQADRVRRRHPVGLLRSVTGGTTFREEVPMTDERVVTKRHRLLK